MVGVCVCVRMAPRQDAVRLLDVCFSFGVVGVWCVREGRGGVWELFTFCVESLGAPGLAMNAGFCRLCFVLCEFWLLMRVRSFLALWTLMA